MMKFENWDWRIKILGPIFYSIAISGYFAYNYSQSLSVGRFMALILIVLGYTVMLVARFQLKDRFSILPQAEKGLMTKGIYGIVRHPIYVSSSLSAVGISSYLSIILDNLLFSGVLMALSACYIGLQLRRAKQEEKVLVEKYGEEYIKYRQRTI